MEGSVLKKSLLLIGLLFLGSCSYSGSLIQKDIPGRPGTVPYRGGTVPYRNDAKAAARRDDAVRKIAKFCGSENYTITHEGASPSSTDLSEVDFQCGPPPSVPVPAGTPAQPQSTGASSGK
jgi:hypothetical protein